MLNFHSAYANLKRLLWGLILSGTMGSPGHSDPNLTSEAPEDSPEAIHRQLSEAFQALGSFQAQYTGVSPKGGLSLTLSRNHKREQVTLVVDFEKLQPNRAVSILDMGTPLQEEGEMILYVGHGQILSRMSLPFRAILHDLSNPLGALMFFIETHAIQVERLNWKLELGAPFPMIMLELTEDSLNAGLGFQSTLEAVDASWLAWSHFQEAEEIRTTPDTVTLISPMGRHLEIHRESGLLFRDQWPEDAEENTRMLMLEKQGPLPEGNPGYRDLIPDFETMEIQAASPVRILALMMTSLHNSLLEHYEDAAAFQTSLENNAEAFATAIREDARILVRETAKGFMKENLDRLPFTETLLNNHRKFQNAQPEDAEFVSFEAFLDIHFQLVQNNPESTLIPPLDFIAGKIRENLDAGPTLLPEGPARRLYQIALPELMNAWLLELLSATFEHARDKAAE